LDDPIIYFIFFKKNKNFNGTTMIFSYCSFKSIHKGLNKKALLLIFVLILGISIFSSRAQASQGAGDQIITWGSLAFEPLWTLVGPEIQKIGISKDLAMQLYNLNLGIMCTIVNHLDAPWYLIPGYVLAEQGLKAFTVIQKLFGESFGVAAGNNVNDQWASTAKYSSWGKIITGDSKTKKTTSFDTIRKSDLEGGAMGLDINFTEDLLVSGSMALIDDKSKFTDGAVYKRAKARNVNLALHSIYNFTSNIYLSAGIEYDIIKEKVNSQKYSCQTGQKTPIYFDRDLKRFSTSIAVGYDAKINDMLIVSPEIGIRGSKLYAEGYKEKSNDLLIQQKLATVKAKNNTNISSVIGLSSKALFTKSDRVFFIPYVYVKVYRDLNKSKPNINISYESVGVSYNVKPTDRKNTLTNIGVGTTILSGSKTYGLTLRYDRFIASKFSSNQGSLELKINF
jgi:hypothetical protein